MKKLYMTLLAMAICLPALAQNFNSAYFIDGYKYRHRLNPAFASTRSYFGLPAVGGVSVYAQSNLGISTLLYPYNGQLTTFMNVAVDADEFLGKLDRNNIISGDASATLFSVGAWGKKGFTSVEFNVKASAYVNLPKDLFDFVKNAGAKSSYDISNLGLMSRNYAELAIGHSHQITPHLNIGAKVKFLFGLASARAQIDKMNITMTQDRWSITADGSLSASVPTLHIPTKAESGAEITSPDMADQLDFGAVDVGNFDNVSDIMSGTGYGAALDLGAEYRFGGILKGLNVSAAILDLGFISWGTGINASTGRNSWEFTGFENISVDGESGQTINDQLQAFGDDLKDMIVFHKEADKGRTEMLSCVLNLAAEYQMPFWRKMSVGFLYSSRIAGQYSKNEGRFFLNLEPAKWFGISASYGASNFGSSLGAIINFDLPGLGLFVGTDYAFWNVTPTVENLGIPLPYGKMNLNLNFGLTFNVSRYRSLGDWR